MGSGKIGEDPSILGIGELILKGKDGKSGSFLGLKSSHTKP
jgi:hypothetical protein